MIDLATMLIPALITPLADGVRGVVARLTGGAGAQPQTVAEAIQLMQAHTERVRALADLDRPAGNISAWVANMRASSRYIAAFAVIGNGIGQAALGSDLYVVDISVQMAQSGFFFLFGDRVYMHLKRAA